MVHHSDLILHCTTNLVRSDDMILKKKSESDHYETRSGEVIRSAFFNVSDMDSTVKSEFS